MSAIALFGLLATVASGFGVGARLLRVARRTRQVPELAIGTSCVTLTLGVLVMLCATRLGGLPEAVAFVISALGLGLLALSTLALAVGVWRIFRPYDAWARGLCGALGVALAVGWLARTAPGTPVTPWDPSVDNLGFLLARAAVHVWAAIECLLHYRILLRRLRLGLADPVITHQFLLWGVSASAMLGVFAIVAYSAFVRGQPAVEWTSGLLATSALGMLAAGGIWCAFFPPAPLRRAACARATAMQV